MPPSIEDDDVVTRDTPYQHRLDDSNAESFTNHQGAENNSTNESQAESTKPNALPIPFLERLRKLPALRSIPWRIGQELPPERSTESPRVQQRGACLLATRGRIMENPCSHCAAGLGRFTACITLDHWFQGACSTCIFTSKGNKCSLRIQTLGKTDGRALRYHSFELGIDGAHIPGPDQLQTSKKRKRQRQSIVGTSLPIPHMGGSGPPLLPASPGREPLRHAETTHDEPTGLLGYVLQKEQRQKRNQNFGVLQDVSQDRLAEVSGSPTNATSAETYRSGRGAMTDISSSQSAGPQTAQTMRLVQALDTPTREAGGRPDWARSDGSRPTPLIDTFPKAKQRQMFGLLSGLQGGIDQLQRQLNLLQASLGIEVEDSEVEQPSRIGTQWMS